MDRLIAGSLGGLVATAPMTAVMATLREVLPGEQRESLPPRVVTERFAEQAGVAHKMDEPSRNVATAVAHFGFGAAAGGVYGLVHEAVPLPTTLKGIVYGLAVCAASYEGLLPSLGIIPPASEHSAERNLLLTAAHAVWGAILAKTVEGLTRTKASAADTNAGHLSRSRETSTRGRALASR